MTSESLGSRSRAARWVSFVSIVWAMAGIAGAIYHGVTR
jgi:hypothetical protein